MRRLSAVGVDAAKAMVDHATILIYHMGIMDYLEELYDIYDMYMERF